MYITCSKTWDILLTYIYVFFALRHRCGFYKLVLFQKYCYNTGCAGAGCTEKLIKYLDDNNIGAYCKANEFGCEVSSML